MKVYFLPIETRIELNEKDLEELAGKIKEKEISVVAISPFLHLIDKIEEFLKNKGFVIKTGVCKLTGRKGEVLGCDVSSIKTGEVIVISDGLFHLKGIKGKRIINFNPYTKEIKEFYFERKNKAGLVLNAKTIGILVSYKIGQRRLEIARKLKERLNKMGKKAYILVGDTFNLLDLENFGFDVYVNTACPRLEDDSPLIVNYGEVLEVLE